MALTQAQKSLIQKAQAAGGGELGTGLSDDTCSFIVATIIRDLNLHKHFAELPVDIPNFFDKMEPRDLVLAGYDFRDLLERLIQLVPDSDTYFACLATLQKARLKYSKVLEYQPIPTMDQVGPRVLLQYGQMGSKALAGFLLWRKWLFDIDNRAGQETGYLFEPIIAYAIGGSPLSASKSPIRRTQDKHKGRQVDCIRGKLAYEIKIRVTIAASGQGRWQEELDFPVDCRHSGYTPVLLVLDPTPNPKLTELAAAFENERGERYIGDDAWKHLEEAAGRTMSVFLEKYVRQPITEMLASTPTTLPDISFKMNDTAFIFELDEERVEYPRQRSE